MELLLLSLCVFLCERSLLFRIEVNPVWMAKEFGVVYFIPSVGFPSLCFKKGPTKHVI